MAGHGPDEGPVRSLTSSGGLAMSLEGLNAFLTHEADQAVYLAFTDDLWSDREAREGLLTYAMGCYTAIGLIGHAWWCERQIEA